MGDVTEILRTDQGDTTVHEVKTYSHTYHKLISGTLTFDIIKSDAIIEEGDVIFYQLWGFGHGFLGRAVARRVNYVVREHESLKGGYVIAGLSKEDIPDDVLDTLPNIHVRDKHAMDSNRVYLVGNRLFVRTGRNTYYSRFMIEDIWHEISEDDSFFDKHSDWRFIPTKQVVGLIANHSKNEE